MIDRLVGATLDALQEYGYHGSSISRIIEKAGVSKGAWSHHFSSKNELIAKAAGEMLKEAVENGKKALLALSDVDEDKRLFVVLDYFWENFEQGRRRDVWIEVYMASRTDHVLRELLSPVIQKFHETLNQVWREYFVVIDDSGASPETVMNLTLYATRGMAIQSIFKNDKAYFKVFRDQWVKMIKPVVRVTLSDEVR